LIERSKKKLEKSLVDAKNELNDLTSRLEVAQTGKIIQKQKTLPLSKLILIRNH
jgi:hypothetical protein